MGRQIEKDGSPADILVVENNPGDARLLKEYLAEAGISNPVHHVSTADQALDFAYQRGEFDAAPTPDLVFLDWNLPTGTGEQVVKQFPDESDQWDIFTIVLTGSLRNPDSVVPSDLGVDGYLTKPIDTDELLSIVKSSRRLSLTGSQV